jgi:hypothetical protein
MSTREIQDIAYKQGLFLFNGGIKNEGMIVPQYNISLAKIEYYFIPSSRIKDYETAKSSSQHAAHRYYGNLIPEDSIKQALL